MFSFIQKVHIKLIAFEFLHFYHIIMSHYVHMGSPYATLTNQISTSKFG